MIDKLAAAAAEGKGEGRQGLPMQLGIEMAAEMIAKIKDEHLCDGVHIMAIGAEKNVPAILERQASRSDAASDAPRPPYGYIRTFVNDYSNAQ